MPENMSRMIELKGVFDKYAEQLMLTQVDFEEDTRKVSIEGSVFINGAMFSLFSYISGQTDDLSEVEKNIRLAIYTHLWQLFGLKMNKVRDTAKKVEREIRNRKNVLCPEVDIIVAICTDMDAMDGEQHAYNCNEKSSDECLTRGTSFFQHGCLLLDGILDKLDEVWMKVHFMPA